jgi:hypothetical protein
MTKIELRGVKFTDSSGRENVGFAFIFGKDAITGRPKIAMMNPDKISELLVQATPTIEEGILGLFAAEADNDNGTAKLPEGKVGGFELEEVG